MTFNYAPAYLKISNNLSDLNSASTARTNLGLGTAALINTPISSANGGTGVNNGASTITLGGSLTTSGAFASTFTMTNTTSVTFPTSGTLATTSQLPTFPLSPASGGTGIANNAASTLTISGNFATTITVTGFTSVTLPTSGTLATTSQIPSLPLTVANGGTGNASQAAFSLVAGGTTTTGAFQAISDVAVGQVLVSGGTGALPAFSATPTVTSITFGSGSALSTFINTTAWTPDLQFGGTKVGLTYSSRTGAYWQIGAMIFFYGIINLSAKGSSTGAATILGLPANTSGNNFICTTTFQNVTYTNIPLVYTSGSGTVTLNVTTVVSAAGFSNLTNTNFANNSQVIIQGFMY